MLKLSASSLGTYEKCPQKYLYQYIEKPDVTKKDWSHLEFGKCAHKVLELFHEDLIKNIRDPKDYSKLMTHCFKLALKEFNLEILKDDLPALKQVLKDYLNKIKKEGLPEVIHNELEFNHQFGDYVLRGFIDRIDKISDSEIRVVDYKTNKNPKYLTNFQLMLYSIIIREKFPQYKTISGSYILLKHNCDEINYEFSDDDIEQTKQKINSIGQLITKGKSWEKKPSILCNWCDYMDICQGNWIS